MDLIVLMFVLENKEQSNCQTNLILIKERFRLRTFPQEKENEFYYPVDVACKSKQHLDGTVLCL
jgi:hypothetical protein